MKKTTDLNTNRWGTTDEECASLGRCSCGCWTEVTVAGKGRCLSCAEVSDAVINGGVILASTPLVNSFSGRVYQIGEVIPNADITSMFRYNGV